MNQFNEAAEAIRSIAAKMRGFEIAATALDSVGSLDQAAKEAQKARDQYVKEAEKAKAQLTKVQADLLEVEKAKAELMDSTRSAADALIADAEKKAEAVILAADAKCKEAKEAYNASLKASIDEAKAEVAKQKSRAEKAKDKADELDAEISAKQVQLDSLNSALAELKAKLGA